ncbi:MAG: dipeptidase [Caldilineaceae bacterium]|nr:dipeptidase [Caldilineaceae bacterium]
MLIFDGDYPMAYGAMELNRDLTLPIDQVRALPDKDPQSSWPNRDTMATLPELRRGKVAGALVKVVGRIKRPNNPLWGYNGGDAAYAAAQGYLAYYRSLARRGEARLLLSREDFAEHFAAWESADQADAPTETLPIGFVLGMEGADPILWPEQLYDWWADGLRVISLTHYGVSTYAHGTGTAGGLTPQAKPLLQAMDKLGMLLDLTHLADESFWQALDLFTGPVLASHQNCRALVPGERQFSDEQLLALIARGGVIGVSMDTWMLYTDGGLDWAKAGVTSRRALFPRSAVTVDQVVDHIDHICQLAGNADHAAIGGDTDGQGGADGAPEGIETVADYQKVATLLAQRGYSEAAIAQIMYQNWHRFYTQWLPAAAVD